MIDKNKYCLLFKTGDAELRALSNIKSNKNKIFPIIELTRGRKTTRDKIGYVSRRISKLNEIFEDSDICIDLTTTEALSSIEINDLYNPSSGYYAWYSFLKELKNSNVYKSILPVLLVNTEDDNFPENLIIQTQKLQEINNKVAYRNNLLDDGCYDDIKTISKTLQQNKSLLYFILDCEYVAPGSWRQFSTKINSRIEKIKLIYQHTVFIVASTSFPKIVSELGNDRNDTFPLNEINLYDEVRKKFERDIIYGDYGSINPIRNDLVQMSRGWIPRIDVPLEREIFYYRIRRKKGQEYSNVYPVVARDYILSDNRFPHHLDNNWGIQQIKQCAEGHSPGSSPSFWISVRMNIHIEQQIKRIRN